MQCSILAPRVSLKNLVSICLEILYILFVLFVVVVVVVFSQEAFNKLSLFLELWIYYHVHLCGPLFIEHAKHLAETLNMGMVGF